MAKRLLKIAFLPDYKVIFVDFCQFLLWTGCAKERRVMNFAEPIVFKLSPAYNNLRMAQSEYDI